MIQPLLPARAAGAKGLSCSFVLVVFSQSFALQGDPSKIHHPSQPAAQEQSQGVPPLGAVSWGELGHGVRVQPNEVSPPARLLAVNQRCPWPQC